jgi:hypothetical protein
MRPGDVQRMSAGSGIRHSEYNASKTDPVHFLQIWIIPERQGIAPGYEQKTFSPQDKQGRLRLVASRDGRDGSVTLLRDADMYATLLGAGEAVHHDLKPGRGAWIHVARGSVSLNGTKLQAGDGAALDTPGPLTLDQGQDAEVLLFDMAM